MPYGGSTTPYGTCWMRPLQFRRTQGPNVFDPLEFLSFFSLNWTCNFRGVPAAWNRRRSFWISGLKELTQKRATAVLANNERREGEGKRMDIHLMCGPLQLFSHGCTYNMVTALFQYWFSMTFTWSKTENPWLSGPTHIAKETNYNLQMHTTISSDSSFVVHTHNRFVALWILSRITRVSRYQKGKINQDFTEATDSKWQWHQVAQCKSASRPRQITTPVTTSKKIKPVIHLHTCTRIRTVQHEFIQCSWVLAVSDSCLWICSWFICVTFPELLSAVVKKIPLNIASLSMTFHDLCYFP